MEVQDKTEQHAGGDGECEFGEDEAEAGRHPKAGYSGGESGCQWEAGS
jgi:hypothetical protein